LPPDHELFFQHARRVAVDEADVVCVIGTPLDFRLSFGRFGADTKLVHIHADATELGRNRAPDAGIVGDCAAVLGILADALKTRGDDSAWLARLRDAENAWWDSHRAEIESDAAPLHHYRLGKILDDVLDPSTVVIGDGGDVVAAVSRVLRVHSPGHWLDPGPFGCLGVGPPYALGVKTAKPAKQVVVVAGDGAFGLNGFEFETLTRFDVPVTFVIGNAAAWGEIRIPQVGIYGDEGDVATGFVAAELMAREAERLFAGEAHLVVNPLLPAPGTEDGLPMPPAEFWEGWGEVLAHYLDSGRDDVAAMLGVLEAAGVSPSGLRR